MKDLVFVSVAFGEQYVKQQVRLKASILKVYPDANIMFWTEQLPEYSKPFLESLYGFKVYAIQQAKKKFQKVLWLDPAMIINGPVDALFKYDMTAVRDENRLSTFISDSFLTIIEETRDSLDVYEVHLVGGSLYYFDFDTAPACMIYQQWKVFEQSGYFGSQEQEATGRLQGHRADESVIAYAMFHNFIEPIRPHEIDYCLSDESVFNKRHFK